MRIPSLQKATKTNILLYIVIGVIILMFAYLIEKNISLPPLITRTIAALGLCVLFFVSFIRPDWVFYILVAYLPFNKILVGKLASNITGINITNIITFFVIIAWLVKSYRDKNRIFTRTPLNIPIIIFMCFGVIALIRGSLFFGAEYAMAYIIPLKRWLTPIFLYFIALNIVRDKRMLKNTVVIIIFVVAVAALMAIYEYLDIGSVSSLDKARVGGIAEQPNMLGGFFVYYMFLFAGFLLVNYRAIKYWLLSIPFAICFLGIQVTFSRGAYIAFSFACLALAFFKNKILFSLSILLLILAVLNPVILPRGMRYRLISTFANREIIYSTSIEDVVDSSTKERFTIWKGAIKMIKEYPLLGVGYGVFPYAIPLYAPIGQIDAHNTYIIIAAEMGIFALLVFLWILLALFRHTYRLYRRSKDRFIKGFALGFLAGLAGMLMVNMFGSRLGSSEVSSYFWILSALIFRAKILEGIDTPKRLVR